jgi:hypothetical protein
MKTRFHRVVALARTCELAVDSFSRFLNDRNLSADY